MLKFKSSTKTQAKINMASTSDIIFLLLIFFMTVTVFKEFQGLKVTLPAAKTTKKIEAKRQITHMWVDRKNRMNIDDMIVNFAQIQPLMREKMIEDPATIISLHADQESKYEYIARIMEELKEAQAFRINFATTSK